MTILLTGSTGFVGNHFLKHSSDIRRVVRSNTRCDLHSSRSFFEVDSICGDTDWSFAFDGIQTVIHLAGVVHNRKATPDSYQSVNVSGTIKLASDAAKAGVKRFVFVSTILVNGSETKKTPFSPDMRVCPINDYAKSKYDAERMLKSISRETGIEIVIVRPTLVYGPNAPGNFGLLTKVVKNLPFLPFGLIDNRRSFISVQNLVDLLITCATHPKAAGCTFLASDGDSVSIKQFTNALAKGLGKKVVQLPIPIILIRLLGKLFRKPELVEQLCGDLEVDSSNLQQVLEWTPPLTMEQAMASLIHSER